MSFLDDAKEALKERFDRLELLNRKVASFESTPDEDKELFDLKAEVIQFVAQRDKQKNLAFLKTGGFSLVDVLTAMSATKEQINKAVSQMFPPAIGMVLGEVKTVIDGKEKSEAIQMGKALSREAMASLKGNEKAFVKCLNAEGKAHLLATHISDAGPFKNKQIFTNLPPILTRFKLDKEKLVKELKPK